MHIKRWLSDARQKLERKGIGTAELDCLVLVEDATGKDRAWLLAHPEYEISDTAQAVLDTQITQRATHLPLAFVRGKTEFFGREFFVEKTVLEPRPESETMIELLLELPLGDFTKLADVGSGSGALGITVKLERPKWDIDLLDIDPKTLRVAQKNVIKHAVHVQILQSDLLKNSAKPYDVLLANLPYVPDSHTINKAATYEPKHAIFGGQDGLDVYRGLFEQISVRLVAKPRYILTESLPTQHKQLASLAQKYKYRLDNTQDFIQVFRQLN